MSFIVLHPIVVAIKSEGVVLVLSTCLGLVSGSIDGVNAYDVCPATSFWLYDETQAQISTANTPAIPAGTQISCQAASAGTGNIYLVSQYLVHN